MQIAAVQIEDQREIHYADHLAPLCYHLEIPLYCRNATTTQFFESIYPKVKFHTITQDQGIGFTRFLQEHDVLIYAFFHRANFEEQYTLRGIDSSQKRLVYMPHGNSEKGKRYFCMERFALEDVTLIYGQRMIDFLKEKNVMNLLNCPVIQGNLRKPYFEKFKSKFAAYVDEHLAPCFSSGKTLLYAPSWNDCEEDSSIKEIEKILSSLPSDWNVLIKLHPRIYGDEPGFIFKVERLQNSRIHLIPDTPLIYPLFWRVDALLGDVSSVLYDFLSEDKPIYFLEPQEPLYIHQTGRVIQKGEYHKSLSIIDKHYEKDLLDFQEARRRLYKETFDEQVTPQSFKKALLSQLQITQKLPFMGDTFSKLFSFSI